MDLCSIASGSSGNCIYVGSDNTGVLIDGGISGKRIEQGLRNIDRAVPELDANSSRTSTAITSRGSAFSREGIISPSTPPEARGRPSGGTPASAIYRRNCIIRSGLTRRYR